MADQNVMDQVGADVQIGVEVGVVQPVRQGVAEGGSYGYRRLG